MSKNTTTSAPAIADVDDPTVDELAAAEAMAKIEDAAAVKVAATFNDAGDIFTRARTIAGAASRGASLENIAAKVTELRVRSRFPRHTDDQILAVIADTKGLRKLKLSVSKSSMQQYASTWTATVDAGVKPTKETIEPMFRVKSTGGHAKPLAALVESLGDAEGEARVQLLVDGLQDVLDGLRSAKKDSEGQPSDGSTSDAGDDEGSDVGNSDNGLTIDGLEGVIRTAIAEMGNWSAEDIARAEAAASALLAAAMGEFDVEAEVAEVEAA